MPAYSNDLPPATTPYETLVRTVTREMEARDLTQTEICRALSLSPVYFSIWLRQKDGMPANTRGLYSSALELWIADAALTIDDPALTNTKASQVPPSRPAGAAASPIARLERGLRGAAAGGAHWPTHRRRGDCRHRCRSLRVV